MMSIEILQVEEIGKSDVGGNWTVTQMHLASRN